MAFAQLSLEVDLPAGCALLDEVLGFSGLVGELAELPAVRPEFRLERDLGLLFELIARLLTFGTHIDS